MLPSWVFFLAALIILNSPKHMLRVAFLLCLFSYICFYDTHLPETTSPFHPFPFPKLKVQSFPKLKLLDCVSSKQLIQWLLMLSLVISILLCSWFKYCSLARYVPLHYALNIMTRRASRPYQNSPCSQCS